ncbi:hypothetical protein K438DRAFT_2030351 [Mycena galopus ATCC 62051]|nr:hypothetical protein K438DRAFT_2030351 [Mycena galopus ATCC 62051]
MPVPTGADAVELASYPPPASIPPNSNPNFNPPPSCARTMPQEQEPSPGSFSAARQAYLTAELCAAQALLERVGGASVRAGDRSFDVKASRWRSGRRLIIVVLFAPDKQSPAGLVAAAALTTIGFLRYCSIRRTQRNRTDAEQAKEATWEPANW